MTTSERGRDGGLQIRPFRASDQVAVRDLILSGLGEHFGFIDESLNPDLDDIMTTYVDQQHAFLVAEMEGEVVGTGALWHEAAGVGRLVRVSVTRERRRQGIGHTLVENLVQLARRCGMQRLLVETNYDWHEVIDFYLGHGFVAYDQDEESTHMAIDL